MESIDTFIGRLPKVDLHLYVVGSASVRDRALVGIYKGVR